MPRGDLTPGKFSGRMIFLIILGLLSSIMLTTRLWQLQVRQGSEYTAAIRKQSIRSVRIPPIRGRIEDRNGQILADTVPVYDIVLYINVFKARGRLNSDRQTAARTAERLEELDQLTGLKHRITEAEILRQVRSEQKQQLLVYPSISSNTKRLLDQRGELEKHFLFKEGFSGASLYLDMATLPKLPAILRSERTAQSIHRQVLRINKILKHENIITLNDIARHIRRYPALELKIFQDISANDVAKIAELMPLMKGVEIIPSTRRHYPDGTIAPHLLGSLDWNAPENEDDYGEYSYFRPEMIGISGIEKYHNEDLRGEGGKKLVRVSIDGYVYTKGLDQNVYDDLRQYESSTVNGDHIVLTIDAKAQRIGTNLMQGKKGALVALDIKTGAVLAMVSTPGYDLNKIMQEKRNFSKDRPYISQLSKNDPNLPDIKWRLPFINRALNGSYMPGSIIKPLIALAGLEHGLWDPEEEYNCEGSFQLGRRSRLRCHNRNGHGLITIEKAIETSCNPFFCNLGTDTKLENILKILKPVGIGRRPLTANEKKHFSQEHKGHLPGSNVTAKRPWTRSETAYISIGQGRINLSPLQAAIFTSAIASEGKVMQPFLVKEIRQSMTDKILHKTQPKQIAELKVKAEHFKTVKNGMRRVVAGDNASARKGEPSVFPIAGKTGSAQVPYYEIVKNADGTAKQDANGKILKRRRLQTNTWFASYAPFDEPQYAVVVLVEDGSSGGGTAAPIARQFYDLWLSATE